jgi:hypothetical protein
LANKTLLLQTAAQQAKRWIELFPHSGIVRQPFIPLSGEQSSPKNGWPLPTRHASPMRVIMCSIQSLGITFLLSRIAKIPFGPFITFVGIERTLLWNPSPGRQALLLADITVSSVTMQSATVLIYPGWSYGLDGKLAKAPKYQDIDGFDKSTNGLFPVHVHIDKLGFIWVNLEASTEPTFSWENDTGGVDQQPRLQHFDMSGYRFDHQWSMMGDYNWKTLADNYNEVCLSLNRGTESNCVSATIVRLVTQGSIPSQTLQDIMLR